MMLCVQLPIALLIGGIHDSAADSTAGQGAQPFEHLQIELPLRVSLVAGGCGIGENDEEPARTSMPVSCAEDAREAVAEEGRAGQEDQGQRDLDRDEGLARRPAPKQSGARLVRLP